MSTVDVKQLKDRLTEYLRHTKQGEEVIITERGKPIALIKPIGSAAKAVSIEAKRVRLVKVTGKPISKVIVEDRR